MSKYELTLIFRPDLKEEEREKIIEKLKKVIGAKKVRADFLGKKALAYEIKKQKEGVYFLLSFEAEVGVLPELEKELKLEESVIRYLIVRL